MRERGGDVVESENGTPERVNAPEPLTNQLDLSKGGFAVPAKGKSSKSPAFQFYPSDFLSDHNQIVMTAEEAGIYIRLMAHSWKHPLTNDMGKLAKLAGVTPEAMSTAWLVVSTCFEQRSSGDWIHPRLERERRKQRLHSRKQTENGLKGGRPVEGVGDVLKTHSKANQNPNKSFSSSSSISSSKQYVLSAFDQFWALYPKRISKAHALKAWLKIAPDESLVAAILSALAVQRRSDNWSKDNGKFIPYPATWLNGRRWEDEITAPATYEGPSAEMRRTREKYADMRVTPIRPSEVA